MMQAQSRLHITNLMRSVWCYRGFIAGSVKREFQVRYCHSLLGAAWTVLNPLAMIVVYTMVFSQLMHARLPHVDKPFAYGIYLCAGLLTWGFFTDVVSRMQVVFLDNGNVIKKLRFPRLCLPLISVLNAGLSFCIIFSLFLGFLLLSGNFPGWVVIGVLPVLVVQIVFSVGLGIILGVLNVFFRDIAQLFGIVLQFWFWFTPIVYTVSTLPAGVQAWVKWNPMLPLIVAYQDIFVSGVWPHWFSLWPVAVSSIVLCWLGMRLFRKHAGDMVDEL